MKTAIDDPRCRHLVQMLEVLDDARVEEENSSGGARVESRIHAYYAREAVDENVEQFKQESDTIVPK